MLLANIIPLLISVNDVNGEGNVRCFKEMISHENSITTNGVIFQDTLVKDNCWRLCYRHVHCASYFKNINTNECRLISGIFAYPTFGFEVGIEAGWKYYAVDNACPISTGYTYNSTANLCFKLSDVEVSYTKAADMCNSDVIGARVIQIRTLEQQTVIAEFLKMLNLTSEPRIDGRRIATSDSWVDANFMDGTAMGAFFWLSAEESTRDDDWDCIKLADDYAWATAHCNKKRRYICEVVM